MTPGQGVRVALGMAVLAVAWTGCAKAPPSAATTGSGEGMRMVDNAFEPQTITVGDQSMVRLTITNEGDNSHTFTIASEHVESGVILPGDVKTVIFPAPDNDVEFVCRFHGAQGMTGDLLISGPVQP